MAFTKLDSKIIDSSIWSESFETRLVWITMLAKSDPDGYVACTLPGLARAANVPLVDVEKAIQILLSPDKYSRTKDNEGRRVEETDGGWIILNYIKYRERTETDYLRDKQRKYRENKKCIDTNQPRIDTVSIPSASESDSNSESLHCHEEKNNTSKIENEGLAF